MDNVEKGNENKHKLNDTWTLWYHLPNDTNWNIDSYSIIDNVSYVEDAIALNNEISNLLSKCMFFVMRKDIKPFWEFEKNRNGGSFSYKVSNDIVMEVWEKLYYLLIGETLTENKEIVKSINGITISPKKMYCIIKIWMTSCEYKDSSIFKQLELLNNQVCIFKQHKPEY